MLELCVLFPVEVSLCVWWVDNYLTGLMIDWWLNSKPYCMWTLLAYRTSHTHRSTLLLNTSTFSLLCFDVDALRLGLCVEWLDKWTTGLMIGWWLAWKNVLHAHLRFRDFQHTPTWPVAGRCCFWFCVYDCPMPHWQNDWLMHEKTWCVSTQHTCGALDHDQISTLYDFNSGNWTPLANPECVVAVDVCVCVCVYDGWLPHWLIDSKERETVLQQQTPVCGQTQKSQGSGSTLR